MTTINSSSPASVWVPPQTKAPESTKLSTQLETSTSSESVSVKISEAALAKLNADVSSHEPPVEAASSGSGNDPPVPPVGTQGGGNGNDPPSPPDETAAKSPVPFGGGNGNDPPQ